MLEPWLATGWNQGYYEWSFDQRFLCHSNFIFYFASTYNKPHIIHTTEILSPNYRVSLLKFLAACFRSQVKDTLLALTFTTQHITYARICRWYWKDRTWLAWPQNNHNMKAQASARVQNTLVKLNWLVPVFNKKYISDSHTHLKENCIVSNSLEIGLS